MIIVNQDNTMFINFDNCLGLDLDGKQIVAEMLGGDEAVVLATYHDEDEATHNFRGIISLIRRTFVDKTLNEIWMPKDGQSERVCVG